MPTLFTPGLRRLLWAALSAWSQDASPEAKPGTYRADVRTPRFASIAPDTSLTSSMCDLLCCLLTPCMSGDACQTSAEVLFQWGGGCHSTDSLAKHRQPNRCSGCRCGAGSSQRRRG